MIKRKIYELLNALGISKKGIFIPHRYVASFKKQKNIHVENYFKKNHLLIKANLELIKKFENELLNTENNFEPSPRWNQDWFPLLDAVSTYALIRKYKPKKIVEIGSGHSTRFIVKSIVDSQNDCKLFCIDPKPRAKINNLPNIIHIPSKIQDIEKDQNLFSNIDLLFIDSSHILMPGSDVDIIFNHIMPKLNSRCLVHIHDIFLPDSYPDEWDWRNYNEQSLVSNMIISEKWGIEWSSHYIRKNFYSEINNSFLNKLPLLNGAFESSLWLKKL